MEKSKKNIPQIRFKGYSEEWKISEINEVCSISTGKSNTQDKVDDGLYPFFVRSSVIEHSNKYLFDEEAVLTAGDGVGTGKVFHYFNGKYDLHQRVYRMFDFNGINGRYFYLYFMTNFYKRVMSMTAKSSVDSVRLDMISEMKINLPSNIDEQIAIGNYFQDIDKLIETNQSKLDKLKNIKKACLEKMFPKKDVTIPEIRFKGFTEEWEEKTLVEIAPLQRGFDLPTQYIATGNIPIVYSNGILNFHKEAKCKGPGLVTGRSGTIGKFTYIEDGEYWPHNTTLWVTDFKGNVPKFIYYLYQTINIIQFATGSGVPTLNRNDVHVKKCFTPKANEQTLIGNYFSQIDKLIETNQRKLTKLKNIKKACLEKMFVNKEDIL